MRPLEEILRDPKAHGDLPSEGSVKAWNEAVLERWSEERSATRVRRGFQGPLATVLFWGSVALGLLYFASLAWDDRGSSLTTMQGWFRETPSFLLEGIGTHPQMWAAAAVLLAVAMTRPLREFLLRQLD